MSVATKLGLAFATLFLVCVCIFILMAKPFSSGTNGGGASPTAAPVVYQRYTPELYDQLAEGMAQSEVDAIMGGGGDAQESETGGQTWTNVFYWNDDGSSIGVTFVDGKLYQKVKTGL